MPITITALLGKTYKRKKEKMTVIWSSRKSYPTTLKTALFISSLRLPHLLTIWVSIWRSLPEKWVNIWVNASGLKGGIPFSDWDWASFDFGFESRLSRHRNFSTGCVNERPEPTIKGVPAISPSSPVSPTRDPKRQVLPRRCVNGADLWKDRSFRSLGPTMNRSKEFEKLQ